MPHYCMTLLCTDVSVTLCNVIRLDGIPRSIPFHLRVALDVTQG